MDPPYGIPPKPFNRPIKPSEVADYKKLHIPEVVFNCFNFLISKNIVGNSKAIVKQSEVLALIQNSNKHMTKEYVFRNKLLDVESAYRSEGWEVEYDKPGLGEQYDAFWTFTIPY